MASTTTRTDRDQDERRRARVAYDPKLLDLATPDDVRATAAEATRRFQRMLPGLRIFARVMTRDPGLQVVMHHGVPCTDGRTIYMRPPVELGERRRHGRNCGDRDERSILVCDACRVTEDVEADLYHEVAHIAFGSFAALDDRDRLDVLTRALADRGIGEDEESRVNQLRRHLEHDNPRTFLGAARLVSPFLPTIVNALEDARVNTEMYRSRPGTHKMFYAQSQQTFVHGIRRDDGTVARWSEAPLNAQVIIGLFAKASGFDYESWFHPHVVEALDTSDVAKVTDAVRTARSVRTIYKLSLTALEVLRSHGFCRLRYEPEDPPEESEPDADTASPDSGDTENISPDAPTEPEPAGEDNAADNEDTNISTRPAAPEPAGHVPVVVIPQLDHDAAEAEAEDEDEDEDEDWDSDEPGDVHRDDSDLLSPVPAPTGTGDEDTNTDTDGERFVGYGDAREAEAVLRVFGHHTADGAMAPPQGSSFDGIDRETLDRAVDQAIVQAEHFDHPSRRVWGVNVHRWGEEIYTAGGVPLTSRVWRNDLVGRQSERWGFDEALDPSVLAPALARARIVFADNRKTRRMRNLRRGTINPRALARRVPVGDPRIFAKRTEPGAKDYFVVVGLDISGSTSGGVVARIKAAGLHMAELLHRLGVRFAVYAHTGTPTNLSDDEYSLDSWSLDIVVVKDPGERWTDETRERLTRVCPLMCNLDGHTLEYYRKVCERQQATDKLVMYFTDGAMPAQNFAEELEILQREIRDAPRRNITIVGVGVGTDSPSAHGLDTVRLDHLDDLPRLVRELERRITT